CETTDDVDNFLCFLNSPIRIRQFIQNVGFEEVFPLKMYDSGSPQRVLSSEVLQVFFIPCEVDAPRRNRRVRTLWCRISHCSLRLLCWSCAPPPLSDEFVQSHDRTKGHECQGYTQRPRLEE